MGDVGDLELSKQAGNQVLFRSAGARVLRHALHRGVDFEATEANGMAIAGSPETVYRKLEAQVGELGVNYLVAYLFFGNLSLTDALRSQQLFAREVMPRLAKL